MAQINLCLRKVCLPTLLASIVVSNILGMSLTILLGSRLLDHVGNLFFPLATAFSTMFTIVFGTFAGYVHKSSTKCVIKFQRTCVVNCGNRNKEVENLMRHLVTKSCTPMKIRFGNNFMAISTPLVILGFVAKNTVRLLLLQET